jgi:hypothetical protein
LLLLFGKIVEYLLIVFVVLVRQLFGGELDGDGSNKFLTELIDMYYL